MKTGAPLLKSRTSLSPSPRERLDALDSWTEQPAAAQAQALGQGAQVVQATPGPPAHDPVTGEIHEPAVPRRRGAPAKHQGYGRTKTVVDPERPWAMLVETVPMKTVSYRLPLELYQQLKWLGDTTFNASMNDIVVAAIEAEVARRLVDRDTGG